MAHQAPPYARLLDGYLVVRDTAVAQYYNVVSLVAGGAQGDLRWISNDHYRGWLPIYAASVLYSWTGHLFWSIAAVDLIAWWLGSTCMFRLAQRLGVSSAGSAVAAFMCATSPAFANSAWMSLFHLANTASLIFATYAVLCILDGDFGGDRGALAAGAAMGLVLFATSLFYNYQWVVVPCLAAVSLVEPSWRRRLSRLQTWALALLVFLVLSHVTHRALAAAGWSLFVQTNDATVRITWFWRQITGGASPAALAQMVGQLLHPGYMATNFHPLVLVIGVLGMALGTWRLRVGGAMATALALAQGAMTGLPWVVINNYPFVYAGVGLVVDQGARILRSRLEGTARLSRHVGVTFTLVAALFFIALTNLDLVGNYDFVRDAWRWLGVPF